MGPISPFFSTFSCLFIIITPYKTLYYFVNETKNIKFAPTSHLTSTSETTK